ncbi:MAG TPA: cupin domain-containing protein [Eudoraea sp.]|nr:cupin domain-containing protein [Eudoraea sp.]
MYLVSDKIISLNYNGLQTQKLVKTDKLEILSISLEKDATFPEHKSPKDAQLIVLEGAVEFYIGQRVYHLKKHQHFSFPKDKLHWVKANENSKFLIIR